LHSDSHLSRIVILEATIAGAPPTFLLGIYGPWAALVAAGEWGDSKLFALAVLSLAASGVFGLSQYWLLAVRTAKGLVHPLGIAFWLAAASAAATAIFLLAVAWPIGLAAILPGIATLHFLSIQRALKRKEACGNAA
jgi:hypothetical protein